MWLKNKSDDRKKSSSSASGIQIKLYMALQKGTILELITTITNSRAKRGVFELAFYYTHLCILSD